MHDNDKQAHEQRSRHSDLSHQLFIEQTIEEDNRESEASNSEKSDKFTGVSPIINVINMDDDDVDD